MCRLVVQDYKQDFCISDVQLDVFLLFLLVRAVLYYLVLRWYLWNLVGFGC